MPLPQRLASSPRRPGATARSRVSRHLARAVATALVALLAVVLPPSAPPASASSVYLCSGYTSCANAGYSHAGYAQRNDRMYWRMYSGHNCTNYVAYRMIQAGMSTERPWSGGSGNAYYWGYAMDDITDRTPAVGAVAWWDRGVPGAGSSGHVAYVERVVSPTEIVISEDSWSGDFHWRRITKSGSGWPTGFIHFVDQKVLTNVVAPRITGTPRVGVALRGYRGQFKPSARQTLQWLADGVAIPGATAPTFTPTAAQLGRAISVRATAAKNGHVGASAVSAATADVAEGVFARGARPGITGSREVGQVLRASPGTWSPTPASSTFQWKANGERIDGATGATLTLTRAMVDQTITVVVAPTTTGYQKILGVSEAFGPVTLGRVALTTAFAASGTPRYGSTLSYAGGTYTPADATLAYQWLRDGVAIAGATASTYALTAEDIGRTVSVRATVSKPRFTPSVSSATFGPVTTPSNVRAQTIGRPRKAIVKVSASAAGMSTRPGGTVTATIAKNVVTARIVNGRARLVLPDLAAGRRIVRIAYSGTSAVEPDRVTKKVRVRR